MNSMNIPKIDANDEVMGATTITEAKENGWPRRISRVFIFDDEGNMLLQKRSKNMHGYPGLWDQAVGGHIDMGESYKDAAIREMSEELGIVGIDIEELAVSYKNKNCFEGIYKAVISRSIEINFDTVEVEAVKWITIEDFEKEIEVNPELYVPAFVGVWFTFKKQFIL